MSFLRSHRHETDQQTEETFQKDTMATSGPAEDQQLAFLKAFGGVKSSLWDASVFCIAVHKPNSASFHFLAGTWLIVFITSSKQGYPLTTLWSSLTGTGTPGNVTTGPWEYRDISITEEDEKQKLFLTAQPLRGLDSVSVPAGSSDIWLSGFSIIYHVPSSLTSASPADSPSLPQEGYKDILKLNHKRAVVFGFVGKNTSVTCTHLKPAD